MRAPRGTERRPGRRARGHASTGGPRWATRGRRDPGPPADRPGQPLAPLRPRALRRGRGRSNRATPRGARASGPRGRSSGEGQAVARHPAFCLKHVSRCAGTSTQGVVMSASTVGGYTRGCRFQTPRAQMTMGTIAPSAASPRGRARSLLGERTGTETKGPRGRGRCARQRNFSTFLRQRIGISDRKALPRA